MKKIGILIAVLLIFPAFTGAVVFEKEAGCGENIVPGIIAHSLNSLAVRINGKNVELKRYESADPVKNVLEAYLAKAERQGSQLINNQYLWMAASAFFQAAGNVIKPDSFGYIFFVDKNDMATFVIAGARGKNTEIIKSVMQKYSGKAAAGYDDGLNHYSGAERALSIEIISGGRVVNFGNFYSISGVSRLEIRNYYNGEFRKKGWLVLKKEYGKDSDLYILKDKQRDLVLSIRVQENGEALVSVIG
jgi:hypothetical protein